MDQGHCEGSFRLQGISGQLFKDLVVLRLLPVKFHAVRRINRLQILDEQRKCCFTTAGITYTVKGLAVGFFDGLLCQFLHGHSFCLFDDLLSCSKICVVGYLRGLGLCHRLGSGCLCVICASSCLVLGLVAAASG